MATKRIARWLRALFGRTREETAPQIVLMPSDAPLVLPVWASWAPELDRAATSDVPVASERIMPRPLAAQLATQARLNVPSHRKQSTRATSTKPRPIKAPVVKRQADPRSAHLQARHMAAKRVAAAPSPRLEAPRPDTSASNPRVVALPYALDRAA